MLWLVEPSWGFPTLCAVVVLGVTVVVMAFVIVIVIVLWLGRAFSLIVSVLWLSRAFVSIVVVVIIILWLGRVFASFVVVIIGILWLGLAFLSRVCTHRGAGHVPVIFGDGLLGRSLSGWGNSGIACHQDFFATKINTVLKKNRKAGGGCTR